MHAEFAASPKVAPSGWLGIVADGVGGRPAGQIASSLAVSTIVDAFYNSEFVQDDRERLVAAVQHANTLVVQRSRTCVSESGMATTVTAAVLRPRSLLVAHVGDSRAYLLRAGKLSRLTQDHTLVNRLVQQRRLGPECAPSHVQRNVITRALGTAEHVDIDVAEVRAQSGDVIMLCTDGLYNVVSESRICEALNARPDVAARALIVRANDAGGPDNVSVVVALLRRQGYHGSHRAIDQVLYQLTRLRSAIRARDWTPLAPS